MKSKSKILIIGFLAIALILFFFLRTNYSERKITTSTPLIDPFKSLMNPTQAKELLKNANYNFTVVENSSLKEGDKRPKFNLLSWKIDNYEHFGTQGSLTVTFLNDQMMSTRFYPVDYSTYTKTLAEKYGFELKTGTTTDVPPKTNLNYNQNLDGNFYIEWQDKELQEQAFEWIKNYS